MHLRQRAMEYRESLSDEEREDARQRAGIMDLEGSPQDSAIELFRRNAAPSEFQFPLPRVFSLPFGVTQKGKELVERTWEAFRKKLDDEQGLAELRIVEEYLLGFEQEFEEQANEKFRQIGRWFRLGELEEGEHQEFIWWYEHQIHLTFQGGYIPPLWKKLHPSERKWLIRERRAVQQFRDAARGAAFRGAVLRNVLWEHVMYGEVKKWGDIPEDKREDMTEGNRPECFISYAEEDQTFVQKLYEDLQKNEVRCWFAPEDLKIGDRVRPTIEDAIRLSRKFLLILSKHAIENDWVEHEVSEALKRKKDHSGTILFPIRIDDAVMRAKFGWAKALREAHRATGRHIGDFAGWKDPEKYHQSFQRLVQDLRG